MAPLLLPLNQGSSHMKVEIKWYKEEDAYQAYLGALKAQKTTQAARKAIKRAG